MEHIPTPEHVLEARPWTEAAEVAPPPDDETGIETAHMARGVDPQTELPVNFAHFTPSDEEIAWLVAGGTIELALIGYRVQPFNVTIWPAVDVADLA